jgi:hypothetical protein
MISYRRCSRSLASFLKLGAGDPNSEKIRTGRTKPGNRFQGHFQGQARQLISQAIGRAILWAAKSAAFKFTPEKCYGVVAFIVAALFIGKIMLDAIYIGVVFGFFLAFCIYAVGCEKL